MGIAGGAKPGLVVIPLVLSLLVKGSIQDAVLVAYVGGGDMVLTVLSTSVAMLGVAVVALLVGT